MSYTFMKVGSSPSDCKEIAKGIDNKLWFAGEHCQFNFIGTVHGAYMSG